MQLANEIIKSLETRLKPEMAQGIDIVFHFDLSGENGGQYTVTVKNEKCVVTEGLIGEPKCSVSASDENYADVELGKTNPAMALMMGKVKVSNIPSMLKFIEMFQKLY